MTRIEDQLAAWTHAERNGDPAALDGLLHPQFLGVGPFGFLLDREQWRQRFDDDMTYTAFEFTSDVAPRVIGDSVLAVGTQTKTGSYQDRPADGAFRVSLTSTGTEPFLAVLHLSCATHRDHRQRRKRPPRSPRSQTRKGTTCSHWPAGQRSSPEARAGSAPPSPPCSLPKAPESSSTVATSTRSTPSATKSRPPAESSTPRYSMFQTATPRLRRSSAA